jgi:hypothetical protein
MALDRAADEDLVRERPVELGGVDEVDAQLEGALDGLDALALIGGAVERGHPHAAEADRGHLEVSKVALIHVRPSLSL